MTLHLRIVAVVLLAVGLSVVALADLDAEALPGLRGTSTVGKCVRNEAIVYGPDGGREQVVIEVALKQPDGGDVPTPDLTGRAYYASAETACSSPTPDGGIALNRGQAKKALRGECACSSGTNCRMRSEDGHGWVQAPRGTFLSGEQVYKRNDSGCIPRSCVEPAELGAGSGMPEECRP